MKFKSLFQSVKNFFSGSAKNDSLAEINQRRIVNQTNRIANTARVERVFYRNAGLSRQERNRLRGELRGASGKKRELIEKILDYSPRNIPYVRGRKILPQHVGNATPSNLILTPQ